MSNTNIAQQTASAASAQSVGGAEDAAQLISHARSCILLVAPEISRQLGLSDIMDDPAVKAALDADPSLLNKTTASGDADNERATEKGLFSSISRFIGNMATLPKSALQDLILYLASSNKLTRLYTDDVHTAFLQPGADISSELCAEIKLRSICIHGRALDVVCKRCTSKNRFSQAMLFKTMNGQDVSCSVCNAHGSMAGCSNSEGDAFVPELLNPKANEDRAMIMAEVDAAARVDLLLIFGNADNASNEFLSIALGIARTSAQTIVVSEANITFLDSVELQNPPIFCRSTIDVVVDGWVSLLTNNTDEKYLDVSTVDPDFHVDSLDTELITGVTDVTLVESSSPTENTSRSKKNNQNRGKKQKGKAREKTNFNHLLNFTLPPRLPPPPTSMVRPRRRVANVYISERQAQMNRSTFINANFRFVLKPQYWQNFKPVTVRPDLQLKWEWIERVIMPVAGEPISCPICLSPPVAARVTECGHVFCYPCILRFLSYASQEERHNKKCPVCWSVITSDDMFPVYFWRTQYLTGMSENAVDSRPGGVHVTKKIGPGSHITMRLMKRLRGTTICLPRSTSSHIYSQDAIDCARAIVAASKQGNRKSELGFKIFHCPWTFTKDALPFAKFVLADREYCIDEYRRETAELECFKTDSTTDLDSQLFAESAILGVDYMIKDAEGRNAHDIAIENHARKEQGLVSGNKSCNSMSVSELDPATPPDTSAANQNSQHHQQEASEDDFVYFYQADDGQHIYMHPLSIRVLSHEHGGYTDMPDELEVKIRHSMESTITDEVRQQFKMLNHLPLRCDILFVEPELKDLVSRKSIDKFRPQLAHRDKHHAARARQSALDDARSEFLAAAAQAMEFPEYGASISGHVQSTLVSLSAGKLDSAGADQSFPDESSFPALNETSLETGQPAQKKQHQQQQQQRKNLWPRDPLPSSSPYPNTALYNDIWEEFERAADATRCKSNNHDDEGDHFDHDDPEDFVISPRLTDGHSTAKKNRKKKVKLVLSGASAHRRR
ncbi:hypothetical protein IWW48_005807 [Coemansia sp. RSA 1200]|nr:hypothetical protein IWW48_005807 [Coemansia sp. RSA 1200]